MLLYRHAASGLEVFLVHPGGPFWANKHEGAWSIPKGEFDGSETPLEAAVREFREETGFMPEGPFLELGMIQQTGGKRVHAWACAGELDPDALVSNVFQMEWPPRSGRQMEFPEVDRGAWFPLTEAFHFLLKSQQQLLDRLSAALATAKTTANLLL